MLSRVQPATADELRRAIDAARAHAAAQRAETVRLTTELPALNAELGKTRRRQEHLQRPSTLVTESARDWAGSWLGRLRARRSRP